MPRKKKTSSVLDKTEQRILGFQAIDPNLDFGSTVNLSQLSNLTAQLRNQVNQYNMLLTQLDSAKDDIETLEKTVREASERMVSGIAFRYGKDSREYEIAGGVRKSDRIRKASLTRRKATPETPAKMA
jgi:hypothetical protein